MYLYFLKSFTIVIVFLFVSLRADVSYFLCLKEIGDVCTQAINLFVCISEF